MWKQGTITDTVRGPIGTSVQRESPSYAYGISTPGRPVYTQILHEYNMKRKLDAGEVSEADLKVDARRTGHSFVMDDGDIDGKDRLIRLRTSTGHQVTMSDDGAAIHISHANGSTWIELGNEGTIDLYSANSINLRTQGQLNFHADEDINFYSGKNINMYAKENIKMECEKDFDLIGKQKWQAYSEKKVLIKSDGTLSQQSEQKTSIGAGREIIISSPGESHKILLNTEKADNIPKPKLITPTELPDTEIVGATGWVSVPKTLNSIVTRAPTHEPYAFHNEGVPVKVVAGSPPAPKAKPAPAKTQAKIDNVKAKPAPKTQVEVAEVGEQANTTNSVQQIGNVSQAGVMSIMTEHAGMINQPLTAITDKGFGKFGITPQHLSDINAIKPGVIDKALSTTAMLNKLKDPALFTGLGGISSLSDIGTEIAQSNIVQQGMSLSLDTLSENSILSGLESAGDTATMLGASLVNGASDVIDWVGGTASSVVDGAMDLVAKGSQFANSLAEGPGKEVIGGMLDKGGIPKSALSTISNVDTTALDNVADALTDNVKIPSISSVSTAVQGEISGISPDNIGKMIEGGITNVGDFLGGLPDTIGDGLENVGDFIGDIPGNIGDGIGSISDTLSDLNPTKLTDLALDVGSNGLVKIAKNKITEFF